MGVANNLNEKSLKKILIINGCHYASVNIEYIWSAIDSKEKKEISLAMHNNREQTLSSILILNCIMFTVLIFLIVIF